MKKVLTIAGSDCSGGAGIQADLKTFSAHGVFGTACLRSAFQQDPSCQHCGSGQQGSRVFPGEFVINLQFTGDCFSLRFDPVSSVSLSALFHRLHFPVLPDCILHAAHEDNDRPAPFP